MKSLYSGLDNFDFSSNQLQSTWSLQSDKQTINFEEIDSINNFLDELKKQSFSEGNPSPFIVSKAEDVWINILTEFGAESRLPLVSSNIHGEILFSYDEPSQYLGIRICDSMIIEIFYKDFEKNERSLDEFLSIDELLESEKVRNFFIH